ncbi:MAG: Maf family protein [Pseudomonadota bacterium]
MYRLVEGQGLVLASASPRRREFLQRLGIAFQPAAARVDESLWPGEDALAGAQRLALAKAQALAPTWPGAAVLAADTLVTLGPEILGKPQSLEQARQMLELLSGQEHQVVTGYCLLEGQRQDAGLAVSRVRFRQLTSSEIEAYLASGEPLGKAGAYAVQGLGAALVDGVRGSYTNVVGLPLARVVELMLGLGIIDPLTEMGT